MPTPTPKPSWIEKGYVDEPIPAGIDLKTEIRRLAQEKNAVILAHYYVDGALQDIADFVGDSLALAQKAAGYTLWAKRTKSSVPTKQC